MKILSIHLGHNSTAVLAEKGSILGVISQEKCDNIKNSAAFPTDAIKKLLTDNNCKVVDVDEIVIAGKEIFPSRAYDYLFEDNNEKIKKSKVISFVNKMEKGFTQTAQCGWYYFITAHTLSIKVLTQYK